MQIEFFHDVICSFCFPMSYKMRQVAISIPGAVIIHRSFALVWDKQDLNNMFGSLRQAKSEILQHWAHANETDPLGRFNIEGMRQSSFDFPNSKNALLAAKASGIIGGEALYWDMFDKLQEALFMKSQNIADVQIIKAIAEELIPQYGEWEQHFTSRETESLVRADIELAAQYQITSVPTLIIEGKHKISGSQPLEAIIGALGKFGGDVSVGDSNSGASCNLGGNGC